MTERLGWQTVEAEITRLSKQIPSGIDIIVAIVRGGLVPARLLASNLGVKSMFCLTIEKPGGKRVLTTQINSNLTGKRILLVEDALETGTSLIEAKKYLTDQKNAQVSTAALYYWPSSRIIPDYTLGTVETIPNFPWE